MPQQIRGLMLHCGSRDPEPCPAWICVPFGALGSHEKTLEAFKKAGWNLAVATATTGQETAVVGGNLRVPGDAMLDPFCPDCSSALMLRLAGGEN